MSHLYFALAGTIDIPKRKKKKWKLIVIKKWSGNILLPKCKSKPNRYKNYTYRWGIILAWA